MLRFRHRLILAVFASFVVQSAGTLSARSVTLTVTGPHVFPGTVAATGVSENGVVLCQSSSFGACVWSEETGTVALPSFPTDMNDSGMVVGSALSGSFTQAWVWTVASGLQYLGTLGGNFSTARAVNNYGVVVGQSATSTGGTRAYVWTETTGMISLGTLHGNSSRAEGINNVGTVVGVSSGQDGSFHAFQWTEAGGMVEIGPAQSEAFVVNDDGLVAGWIDQGSSPNRIAFVWAETLGLTQLGLSAVRPRLSASGVVASSYAEAGSQYAWAWTRADGVVPLSLGGVATQIVDMNDAGMLVGQARLPVSSQTRAWVWTPAGGMINLGTLGGSFSGAWGVNNHGVVVGQTNTSSGAAQAFAWTPEAGMVSLGPQIGLGGKINDSGLIVGQGRPAGVDAGVSWTISFAPSNVAPTPVGMNVQVQPTATLPDGSTATVSLAFDNVTSGGTTTVETSTSGPPPRDGFRLGQPPVYYDVTSNATFSGAVTLCLSWAEGALRNEGNARLLHFENGAWMDVTTSINTTTNIACGRVTSLSPFAIAEFSYQFLGFGTPLLSDGSASIQQNKAGRAIPVKFQLKFNGQITGAATATIAVFRMLNVATGTVDTTDLTEDAGAANENSDRFRYDANAEQYIYNLNTKGWQAPATYRIVATLDDGSTFAVDFSLR